MTNHNDNLNALFDLKEGATFEQKRKLDVFFTQNANHNISKLDNNSLLSIIKELIDIFKPKELKTFIAILNPNTGFIDERNSKLLFNILFVLKERMGLEHLNAEIEKLLNKQLIYLKK